MTPAAPPMTRTTDLHGILAAVTTPFTPDAGSVDEAAPAGAGRPAHRRRHPRSRHHGHHRASSRP